MIEKVKLHIFSLLYNGNASDADIIRAIRESTEIQFSDKEILELIQEIEPLVFEQYCIDSKENEKDQDLI